MNKYAAGAFAGLLATVPMTLTMKFMFPYLPRRQRYPLPPHEITVNAAKRAGLADQLPPERRTEVTLAAHFGFGALSGAPYPVTAGRLHISPAFNGAVFGVAVWGLSYLGWVPGLGLLRPAISQPKERVGLMILAYLVWGPATAGLANVLASGNQKVSGGSMESDPIDSPGMPSSPVSATPRARRSRPGRYRHGGSFGNRGVGAPSGFACRPAAHPFGFE